MLQNYFFLKPVLAYKMELTTRYAPYVHPILKLCQTLPIDENDESNINHSIKRMLLTLNQMYTKFRQCGLI